MSSVYLSSSKMIEADVFSLTAIDVASIAASFAVYQSFPYAKLFSAVSKAILNSSVFWS